MNEVIQVRMNGWAVMVKARIDSGMTIREWCAANGVSQDAHYYRLRKLRKAMLETVPKQSKNDGQTKIVQVQQADQIGNGSISAMVTL